jgi:hypothetical protein
VESSVGHAQRTPLKGLRFEAIEPGQEYLDRWEENWADTRIHGTTKRQVSAMFSEERPHLGALPAEPFRYYQYGTRTIHLDGCFEIGGAYYRAPPGLLGRLVQVQWDERCVRLIHPTTHKLVREYPLERRGHHQSPPEFLPRKTPATTLQLLARARQKFQAAGIEVVGVSAQDRIEQQEFVARNRIPFVLLSDPTFQLRDQLRLPTFDSHGRHFYRRLALVFKNGTHQSRLLSDLPSKRKRGDHPRGVALISQAQLR